MNKFLTDTANQEHFKDEADSETKELRTQTVSFNSLRRSERQKQEIEDLKAKLDASEREMRKLQQRYEFLQRQYDDVCKNYRAATKSIFHSKTSNENVDVKVNESLDKCVGARPLPLDSTAVIVKEIRENGQRVIDTLKTEFREQKHADDTQCRISEEELKAFSVKYGTSDCIGKRWRSFSIALGLTEDAIDRLGAQHHPHEFGYQKLVYNILKHWSKIDTDASIVNIRQAAEDVGISVGSTGACDVPEQSTIQATFKKDPQLKEFCSKLAEGLGSQWRYFARRLGISGDVLDQLEQRYGKYGNKEVVWCVLERWVIMSEAPCKDELERATREIGAYYIEDEPMEQVYRDVIFDNFYYLYKELMSVELLFPGLLAKGVINEGLVEEIKLYKGDSERRLKFLIMLPNLGRKTFPAFLREVDRHQNHVVSKLNDDVNRRVEGDPENKQALCPNQHYNSVEHNGHPGAEVDNRDSLPLWQNGNNRCIQKQRNSGSTTVVPDDNQDEADDIESGSETSPPNSHRPTQADTYKCTVRNGGQNKSKVSSSRSRHNPKKTSKCCVVS